MVNSESVSQTTSQSRVARLRTQKLLSTELKEFSDVASAVVVVDSFSIISFVDDKAEKLFGFSKSELIGQNLSKILPERKKHNHQKDVDSFTAGAATQKQMSTNRTIDVETDEGTQYFNIILAKVFIGKSQYSAAILSKPDDEKQQSAIEAIRDDYSQKLKKQKLKKYFISRVFRRLLAIFLLSAIALGGSVSTSWIVYTTLSGEVKSRETKKMIAIRDFKKQAVEAFYDDLSGDLKLLASESSSPYILEGLRSLESQVSTLQDVDDVSQAVDAIEKIYAKQGLAFQPPSDPTAFRIGTSVLKNNSGTATTSNPQYRSTHEALRTRFNESANVTKFSDFLILNKQGRALFTNKNSVLVGSNLFQGDWRLPEVESSCLKSRRNKLSAIRMKEPGVPIDSENIVDFSDIYKDYSLAMKPSQVACYPIFEGQNLQGYVVGRINVNQLQKILDVSEQIKTYNFSESLSVYLVGEDFTLRTEAPSVQKIGLNKLLSNYGSNLSQEILNSVKQEKTTVLNLFNRSSAVDTALAGQSKVISSENYFGESVVSAVTPVAEGDLKWVLLVEVSTEEINRTFVRAAYLVVLCVGVFAVVFVYAVSWLTKAID